MLIEAARRAEAAVKEMLAMANDGSATTDEFRDALGISKAIAGVNSAFQVAGAAAVAGRERHGDGGAEVLAASAGLSRREAHSQVKTAEALRVVPEAFDAVAQGAGCLRQTPSSSQTAVERTSAADVGSDCELLAKAESMRPETVRQRQARRWVTDRDGDGGQSEHARQRARRCVRVWDGDDGMVHLRGEFDTVTGRRIGNRLRAEAARMYDADKKNSKDSGERRTFQQCMADALDNLTTNNNAGGGRKPIADICVVAHVDDATGKLIAEIPGGDRLPAAVLEELACNAEITPAIYNTRGALLWQGHSKRTATSTQLKALKALYGGCFACGADFEMCQAHHVKPVSEGGPTNVDNMVPACWGCHNKIHYFNWQIHGPPGKRTLHPPDSVTYGPAQAPEPALEFGPRAEYAPRRTARLSDRPSRTQDSTAALAQTDRDDPADEAHAGTGPSPPRSRSNGSNGSGRLFAFA